MLDALKRPAALIVSLLLLGEIAAFYAYPKTEVRPLGQPLSSIPTSYRGWDMISESQLETEVQELLKADETVNRVYVGPDKHSVSMFAAFFKTQRTGVAPHSPKVCLPGSGWVPSESDRIPITVSGEADPIVVNRYVVTRGEYKSLVLYWYQTPYRVIANEYAAKFYTVVDGLRHRRSDTSMVRLIVPVADGKVAEAEQLAIKFAQDFFPKLKEHLPRS